SEAIQTLVKQGTIRSAVARAADDLRELYDQLLAKKFAEVFNAAPSDVLSTCAAQLPPPITKRDPWGNAYVVRDDAGLPICIYSTGGTGVPPDAACTCESPTMCRNIDKLSLNS